MGSAFATQMSLGLRTQDFLLKQDYKELKVKKIDEKLLI